MLAAVLLLALTSGATDSTTGHPAAASRAAAARPALPALSVDSLVVEKAAHRLTLYVGARAVRTYRVALGRRPVGPKRRSGDLRTPEGVYRIDWKNPHSRYHLALHVSYPGPADRARALARGRDPGGDIMLHGLPNGSGFVGAAHRLHDWTDGCIAVTDEEIEEIFRAVPLGAVIDIRP